MNSLNRRRIGLVASNHRKLMQPSSLEDTLNYAKVRNMVWQAIEYGRPRAGSLEAKIRPGSWVVIKPNIVYLRPQSDYRLGDITDMRVTKTVLEYVATKSRARRITIAEGGSYRNLSDQNPDTVISQNGVRVPYLPPTIGSYNSCTIAKWTKPDFFTSMGAPAGRSVEFSS